MKDQKNILTINDDIIKTIIQICFDVNDFKHQNRDLNKVLCQDEDIIKLINKIISSTSNKELLQNVVNAKNQVEILTEFYKTAQVDKQNKFKMPIVLHKLESDLLILQEEIKKEDC